MTIFVGVKVGANWVMSNSSECNEASGSYTPSVSGYYPVEFRVGNNRGVGGLQGSAHYGIKWCTSADGTWRNVGNTASETIFFVNRTDGEFVICNGVSSPVLVNLSSEVNDGMEVSNDVELAYSAIGTGGVSLEINGRQIHSAMVSGTYTWSPTMPGTYVLTQSAGGYTFTRKVVYPGEDDARELEIGWLDGPISNLFPNICASVTNVVIAPTVTHIPNNAFAGCEGLKFDVNDGIVSYNGCILGVNGECPEHVVIPEGIRSTVDGVFRGCSGIVSVSLPSTLKYIGADAFRECTSLESVKLPEGLEEVGDGAFRDCTWVQEVEFPSSLVRIGDMAFANCSMLAGIECQDGLQVIGDGAFSNCWRMLSVELPASVDEIGVRAFYNCKSVLGVSVPARVDVMSDLFPDVYAKLQSVVIAEGETELSAGFFRGCQALEDVELPDEIVEIPDSTFEGCSLLRQIRLPGGLVRIGNRAFYGCGQIHDLELPEGLVEIGDDAFNGVQKILDLKCPASVKHIGARAFKGVWDDVEVKLPERLESLGTDAFANCPSIRKISLPAVATPIKTAFPAAYSKIDSVKILGVPEVIPSEFCRDVVQLSGVEIPSSVTNIGEYAFSGLSNLAAIELPPNLRMIGEYAFNGDSRLVTIDLPQAVEMVGYRAFYGCGNIRVVSCSGELGTISTLFPSAYSQITTVSINTGTKRMIDDLLSGCSKLSEIDVPAGVMSIGARAFKNCTALKGFGVPNGVVIMGSEVFYGCTGLTTMSLPDGLTTIPESAFRGCKAISSIVIPASVTSIGADAFNGCSALKSISYLGSCPVFDAGCYNGTPSDLTSYVVFGSRGWDGVASSKTLPESWPTSNSRAITYWEPNTFEATFDANGGTPESSKVVQTTGMTYILPEDDPEMLGARFDGWWTQPVNGGRIKTTTKVEVTRAQTFYAHWKYNSYSVRFDANGGIGEMEGQSFTVNGAAGLSANQFVRKDCRFAGWALSSDGEVEYADGAEVVNLSFEQDAVVTLYAVWEEQAWTVADYLNTSGMEFETDGDAEWVKDDDISHDGIGSMRSGAISAADEGQRTRSAVRTVVRGEGSGSFWWKVDCEPSDGDDYYDYCVFTVDGVEIDKIAGTNDWANVDYVVSGAGEHVLEWTFTRDDYDEDESLYENAAWLDEFSWTPTPITLSFDAGGADGEVPAAITKFAGCEVKLPEPSQLTKNGMVFVGWTNGDDVFVPGDIFIFGSSDVVLTATWEEKVWTLEEAANLSGQTLVTGGTADWIVDLTTNHDGVASIRSGVIGDDQQTWVSLVVSGPGTVGFCVYASGEYNRGKLCDYLKFEIDGKQEFASYDAAWSNVVVTVSGAGAHTLKWTYLKNGSKSAGYDCAWLDEIVWTPSEVPADPIPELVDPTPEQIAEVFEAAEDPKLAENVTTAAEYAEFREWAGKVKDAGGETAGSDAVMASPNAWLSFALGADTLIETAPADSNLTVEAFSPSTNGTGKFEFTVSVKDIDVSSEASKENLKKVFGLEGTPSLGATAFSADDVDIIFGTPEGGKVKFTAGPKDVGASSFFMKLKVLP